MRTDLVDHIDFGIFDGCWAWTGCQNGDGYGYVRVGGHMMMAHRAVWRQAVGPIPEGLTLDHLCRHHLCVNPDHLEPVTLRDNIMRGLGFRKTKISCQYGHPFDADNTYLRPTGWRECRTCRKAHRPPKESRRLLAVAESRET